MQYANGSADSVSCAVADGLIVKVSSRVVLDVCIDKANVLRHDRDGINRLKLGIASLELLEAASVAAMAAIAVIHDDAAEVQTHRAWSIAETWKRESLSTASK